MSFPKSSGRDLVEDLCEPGCFLFNRDWVIQVLVAKVFHSWGQVPEEDYKWSDQLKVTHYMLVTLTNVALADFFGDFDVSTVYK